MRKRLSVQQRRVLDAGATLIGFDSRGRPVVQMMAGIPNQLRTWAVTVSGDPTSTHLPIERIAPGYSVSSGGEVTEASA